MPNVITHNYDPARGPFRNICDLPVADALRILDEIRPIGRSGIKPDYLERRIAVETWLLAERTRKLGVPRLTHPIYFFLGNMADGLDPSRPSALLIPLAHIPENALTFTYPDSMASLPLFRDDAQAAYRKPYHGQVFTLAEIRDVIAEHGMPGDRWKTEDAMRYDRFVEVQVWDDRPLGQFLDTCAIDDRPVPEMYDT